MTTHTLSSPLPHRESLSKEGFVHRLFDRISPRYDLFNRVSSFGLDQGWRKQAILRLKLLPGMRALDMASGTGDLAKVASEQLAPLGFVAACDLSYPMLRFAKKKLGEIPVARWHVQFSQARAEALPFSEESFDAATIGFALRNVTDLDGTFRELSRVMKPGGRLCLLEFGRPRNWLLKFGADLWLTIGVPVVGLLTTGTIWPFLYLRRSILQFLSPEEVVEHLKAAGFSLVHAEPFTGGIVFLYTASRP